VIITVGTELVGFFELLNVLSETLPALLASKDHFEAFLERMVLLFTVTLNAVKPFSAAWRSDGDLRVENVFAHVYK